MCPLKKRTLVKVHEINSFVVTKYVDTGRMLIPTTGMSIYFASVLIFFMI